MTKGEPATARWMTCHFEGFALGQHTSGGFAAPAPGCGAGDDRDGDLQTFQEGASFNLRVVRGRAEDIKQGQEPLVARPHERHLFIDELPEFFLPKKRTAVSLGPEWRAVRVHGARLYDVVFVPLECDGSVTRSSIAGTLFFDAAAIDLDGPAGPVVKEKEPRLPGFSRDGTGRWFADLFTPFSCLTDLIAGIFAVRHVGHCREAVIRVLAAYALLRLVRSFAPLEAWRQAAVNRLERTDFGTAALWALWAVSALGGIAGLLLAFGDVQTTHCAADSLARVGTAAVAGVLMLASPAQRLQAPAIFALPLLAASAVLTCPSANFVCDGDPATHSDRDGERAPEGRPASPSARATGVPCAAPLTQGGEVARPPSDNASAHESGANPSISNAAAADDGGATWIERLREQSGRLADAVTGAGAGSDEKSLLAASGAAATKSTLDDAEEDDPFREAAGLRIRGAHDTFCGKPLFLPASELFAPGGSAILPGGESILRRVGRLLVRHRERAFIVAGHVPSESATHPEVLSRERAVSIAAWLKAWPGLAQTTFVAQGLGNRDGLIDSAGKGTVARLNDRIEVGLSCADGAEVSESIEKQPKKPARKRVP